MKKRIVLAAVIAVLLGMPARAGAISRAEMIRLTNRDRVAQGSPSLVENGALDQSSEFKAMDMERTGCFSHYNCSLPTPWAYYRLVGYNYRYAGENLGKWYGNAEGLEAAFMASSEHRANILGGQYKEIGVGVVGNYIVIHFGAI